MSDPPRWRETLLRPLHRQGTYPRQTQWFNNVKSPQNLKEENQRSRCFTVRSVCYCLCADSLLHEVHRNETLPKAWAERHSPGSPGGERLAPMVKPPRPRRPRAAPAPGPPPDQGGTNPLFPGVGELLTVSRLRPHGRSSLGTALPRNRGLLRRRFSPTGHGRLQTSRAFGRRACTEHQHPQGWCRPQGGNRRPWDEGWKVLPTPAASPPPEGLGDPREEPCDPGRRALRREGLGDPQTGPGTPDGGAHGGRGRASDCRRVPRTQRRAASAGGGGPAGSAPRPARRSASDCLGLAARRGVDGRARRSASQAAQAPRVPSRRSSPARGAPASARLRSGPARWRLRGGARPGRPRAAGRQSGGVRAGTGSRGQSRASPGSAGPRCGRGQRRACPRGGVASGARAGPLGGLPRLPREVCDPRLK